MNRAPRRGKADESGFVLVMALIFLLILTLMGATAMSTTGLEEKMAGNVKDKSVAFQSAETGLLGAEAWIKGLISKPAFPDTAKGFYVPSTDGTPVWNTVDWASANVVVYPCTPSVTSSCGATLANVAAQPKYIIEDLGEMAEAGGSLVMSTDYKGKGSTVLRITARGVGATDTAQAMVQSIYVREF